ncbi:hypothetical protein [Ornithinibacillus sp. JPR2-1]|uniref:hypothetical protein n=1 Tax=Ornithinibacillus sp. JPR2-1 TaxID=2094019 RepID=UPI0031D33729
MSKERLEEIKQTLKHPNYEHNGQEEVFFMVSNGDFDWLIKQAEYADNLRTVRDNLIRQIDTTQLENQRYKQALEFYADPENHDREVDYGKDSGLKKSNVDIDRGFKARQAIKGDANA